MWMSTRLFAKTLNGAHNRPPMTDRHQQKPYPLRMPDELRTRLEHAAAEGSRSLHAEIVARLQASFTPSITTPNVKFSGVDERDEGVYEEVSEFAKKRGMSYRDALMLLVQAGLQPNAPQIVHIRVGAGATMQEVRAIISEAAAIADPSASVIYESGGIAREPGQR